MQRITRRNQKYRTEEEKPVEQPKEKPKEEPNGIEDLFTKIGEKFLNLISF